MLGGWVRIKRSVAFEQTQPTFLAWHELFLAPNASEARRRREKRVEEWSWIGMVSTTAVNCTVPCALLGRICPAFAGSVICCRADTR